MTTPVPIAVPRKGRPLEAVLERFASVAGTDAESLADDVGADPETVRRAAERRVYERTVDRDVNRGDDAGVESTPTVLVDGEIFRGRTWSDLVSRIEAARADPRSEPS